MAAVTNDRLVQFVRSHPGVRARAVADWFMPGHRTYLRMGQRLKGLATARKIMRVSTSEGWSYYPLLPGDRTL